MLKAVFPFCEKAACAVVAKRPPKSTSSVGFAYGEIAFGWYSHSGNLLDPPSALPRQESARRTGLPKLPIRRMTKTQPRGMSPGPTRSRGVVLATVAQTILFAAASAPTHAP